MAMSRVHSSTACSTVLLTLAAVCRWSSLTDEVADARYSSKPFSQASRRRARAKSEMCASPMFRTTASLAHRLKALICSTLKPKIPSHCEPDTRSERPPKLRMVEKWLVWPLHDALDQSDNCSFRHHVSRCVWRKKAQGVDERVGLRDAQRSKHHSIMVGRRIIAMLSKKLNATRRDYFPKPQ